MARSFPKLIPKIPLYRRNTYEIPDSYSKFYEQMGIMAQDQKKALFYANQFGGFRLKKIPSYLACEQQFLSRWFRIKNENGYMHFRANPQFIATFGDIYVEPILRHHFKKKRYSEKVLDENGFTRQEASEIESIQDSLNRYYSNVRLNVKVPNSGITADDRIELTRFNSIPHFQYMPKAGGRLFQSGPGSSFQRISSNLRPYLTMNDDPTMEIDITAASFQFLHIVVNNATGKKLLPDHALAHDPYRYFLDRLNSMEFKQAHLETSDISRDDFKSIIYTLIYSKKNCQENQVNRRLRLMGKNFKYSDIAGEFPSVMQSISEIKSFDLNNRIYPIHIMIHKEESRYAREVLKRCCIENDFPVLPIHDSFIATLSNGKRLENIIRSTSMDFYGYIMPYKYKI